MASKVVSSLRSTWDNRRRARSAIGVTPYEQAQRSWARPIAAYADVPADYAAFFEPLRASGAPFPLVVIAPSYEGFLHREVETVVAASADDLTFLERRGHRLVARRYPFADISCLSVSSALLDARLKVLGLEGDDRTPASTTIRFNAVTEFMFSPIISRVRLAGRTVRAGPDEGSTAFREWGQRSFKFMNYARRSLLGDETVLQAILQPEIRVPLVSAFGRSLQRTISPTHATILTEFELISIREGPISGQERYGGVWSYIPLPRISDLSVSSDGRGVVRLVVRLPGDSGLDLLYDPSAEQDVRDLVEKAASLKSGVAAGEAAVRA